MFSVKKLDIDSAYEFVAVLLVDDANELGLWPMDRIKIENERNGKFVVCILDVAGKNVNKNYNTCPIVNGEIGLFENVYEKLELLPRDRVNVGPAKKPSSLEFIKKKFEGNKYSSKELDLIVSDITNNVYSQIETTYFVVSGSVFNLDDDEVAYLADAMIKSGVQLDFKVDKKDIIVDKHCIGGIPGNRTTLAIVPIVAAAGLTIPKTSSRSITSPAGTADTMEVFADVDVGLNEMVNIVKSCKGCILSGGNVGLSPADDIIVHVEHPLEIDSEGQMIASILSKKKSAGSTHVLIDIPFGETAKVKSIDDAKRLKKRFEKIGSKLNLFVNVIITDGSEPIGRGIGPLNEAEEIIRILKNEGSSSSKFKDKILLMAGEILEMGRACEFGEGYNLAEEILSSGRAFEKFQEIIEAQGRNEVIKKAKFREFIRAEKTGIVQKINNMKISKLAFILGAPKDKAAGLILFKKTGESVAYDDVLYEICSSSKLRLEYAKNYIKEHIDIYSI